jgi:hypothetical protein
MAGGTDRLVSSWLHVCVVVLTMLTVTWLALWAASEGNEGNPAAAALGNR